MNPATEATVIETLACSVCLQEIPSSEASSSEARDYVAGFCGLDCYVQWQAQGDAEQTAQAPTRPTEVTPP
ncbi:DUF3330 domain-containing protein [Chitinimonas arctica]|uniref:DUF3330 domain-containing protein n=1 Tax=Chitinimonas arctica TaxID=2594795 RepID=A0A516SH12_9NEIS|nr:DUF3330 domain-containing protein [Chitinimonas arctica]QDQ27400.1 DUF3330 domain-containing protein [Chitinimonas arctica]